jgi:phosphopantothenoylcysteine decarboxylase/phosphopantothenate--cysteine ligase
MGFALATEAARRGAAVELIAANVSLATPANVARTDVTTTAELAAAARDAAARSDVILMAAAPADFRPAAAGDQGKIEREGDGVELRLEPTEDILAGITAARRPGQTIIGFAAEHGPEGISRARLKLDRKAVDAIVFNDISDPAIGFDSGENAVTIITAAGETEVERASKDRIAAAILDQTLLLRG